MNCVNCGDSDPAELSKLQSIFIGQQSKRFHKAQITADLLCLKFAQDIFNIRRSYPSGMLAAGHGMLDMWRSTLILVGDKYAYTGIHVDWTEAHNVAYGVGDFDQNKPVAEWMFISPQFLSAAENFFKGEAEFIFLEKQVHLTGAKQQAFIHAMPRNSVIVLQQYAGDRIYVPPGWPHQVTNFQTCIKVAFDVFDPPNFVKYAQLQKQCIQPFFATSMAPDYMGFNSVMNKLLETL